MLVGGVDHRLLQQDLTVLGQVNDIRVIVCDADAGAVAVVCRAGDLDIQQAGRLAAGDVDGHGLQKCRDGGLLRFRHIGDDLQFSLGVPGDDADGDGGLNPLLAAGIGDDDTFDILQNIPADRGRDFVRQTAQQGAHFCGAVGNGDGLGAAGGQHELLLQNGDIVFINSIVEHSVHLDKADASAGCA